MMAVSKALRYEIMRRDNYTCRYCGATAPDAKLTIDHVTPTTLGGTDDPTNLVVACADCNSGKRAVPPGAPLVADVAQDAIRWAKAQAAALAEKELVEATELNVAFYDHWKAVMPQWAELPLSFAESLAQFRSRGLPESIIRDAVFNAAGADRVSQRARWSYFCGICWKKIARLEETAASLLLVQETEGPDGP